MANYPEDIDTSAWTEEEYRAWIGKCIIHVYIYAIARSTFPGLEATISIDLPYAQERHADTPSVRT